MFLSIFIYLYCETLQRTKRLKIKSYYVVATCKIAECKSVRDLVSFVLQKVHERTFEPDETFKKKETEICGTLVLFACKFCKKMPATRYNSRIISFYDMFTDVNPQNFMILQKVKHSKKLSQEFILNTSVILALEAT